MGAGNFNVNAYVEQAAVAKKQENAGFTAKSMCDEFNPASVEMRASKRGPFNEFRDVITVLIGLDVTGSMDIIPKSLLEGKLGTLMVDLKKTFNRPNENLQISFAGIGDAKSDSAPLQVTHFESDNRFAQQLQKIWLEGHGGANGAESYNLLWWYAGNKTHLNYVQSDQRKGILITIGDDNVHPNLTGNEIQMWLDTKYKGGDISNPVLLAAARQQYEVYHIIITDGHSYQHDYLKKAKKTKDQNKLETDQWIQLLGKDNVLTCKSDAVAASIADIVKRHRPQQKMHMMDLTDAQWEKKNKENLTDQQWKEVLSYALCPLSRQFMEQPVEWGHNKRACERKAVENYVRQQGLDPISHQKVTLSELILKPNLNIAQLCSNYKPFFEALPENRKAHLIELIFPNPIKAAVEEKKTIEVNPYAKVFVPMVEDKAQLPASSGLECPITHEIMKDPVLLVATGQTYERAAIEGWLQNHNTDPISNQVIADKTLVPNYMVKSLCEEAARSTQQNTI